MINFDQLKQLAQSDSGVVLIEWLDTQIKEMSDITKIKEYDELLGKQEAVKILKELFSFLNKSRVKPDKLTRTDYK